jgi:opacity protein-like surface antigen
MNTSKLLAAAVIGGILGNVASADDSLVGAYLGAGIGNANVRVDQRPGNIALGLKEQHSAWKALVDTDSVVASARQSGGSIHAVGYLPLPIPLLDVYGKAGTTRLQTRLDGVLPALTCVAAGCNEFHSRATDTSFTWGAGVQLQLPLTGLSARAEYERYDIANGAPDLVSVNLLWRL